ncbi:phage tail collar domain protein [Leptospira broomii serovar Hurstbridge str. 5399]|uniref:Phage tail collar domain protein n=1 Tax=Leptospira broomii serovar Hurstbridge str. 5399 TaxID=1049789 RepID=T0F8H5_9LEPT|nr:tail fiber protein [Leptospira broomii]EQA44221.1 phage tail collar domain protein [Leptospira broomii serovar Hurstbridge str. 5399]
MSLPNPNKSRTWDRNTSNDGLLLDVEFNRLYANDNAVQAQRDSDIANLQAQINALMASIGQQSNIPLGAIIEYDFSDIPQGFQIANGQTVSRAAYPALWAKLHRSVTGIVPTTNTIQSAAHGLSAGQLIKFSFTGYGITLNTFYYVINPTTNDFQISLTLGGMPVSFSTTPPTQAPGVSISPAVSLPGLIMPAPGGAISVSIDLLVHVQYGFGDGSSTFTLPDRRGVFARGAGLHATRAKAAGGNYNGGAIGFEGQDAMQGHFHAPPDALGIAPGSVYPSGPISFQSAVIQVGSPTTDGINGTPRTGNETTPASTGVQYIVRVQ